MAAPVSSWTEPTTVAVDCAARASDGASISATTITDAETTLALRTCRHTISIFRYAAGRRSSARVHGGLRNGPPIHYGPTNMAGAVTGRSRNARRRAVRGGLLTGLMIVSVAVTAETAQPESESAPLIRNVLVLQSFERGFSVFDRFAEE